MNLHLFIQDNLKYNDSLILKKFKKGFNYLRKDIEIKHIKIFRVNNENINEFIINNIYHNTIVIFSILCINTIKKIENILEENKISCYKIIFLFNHEHMIDEFYKNYINFNKKENINIYSTKLLIDEDQSNELIFLLFDKFHVNSLSLKFIKNENRLKDFDIVTEMPKKKI